MENLIGKTVYVTKYALTKGIFKGTIARNTVGEDFITLKDMSLNGFYLGKDAFLTEEDAKEQAEILRDKKMVSLENQIRKLATMEF
jgi:hypothetical protein